MRGLVGSRHQLGERIVGGQRVAAGFEPGGADRRGMVAEPPLLLACGQDRCAHPRLGLLGAPGRGMPHPDPEGRGRGHARRPIARAERSDVHVVGMSDAVHHRFDAGVHLPLEPTEALHDPQR